MQNVVLIAHPAQERLEALIDRLEAAGINCITARDGAEALATASSYLPQLAVLQAELTEIEGTDVCLRLKQEPTTERIRIILISKDESVEERFVSEEVGADDYLVEPFTDDELLGRIRSQLSALQEP